MPQAIERLLATPMINPRLPRIRVDISGMDCPVLAGERRPFSYGIGCLGHQAMGQILEIVAVNSIHFREYDWNRGVFLTIDGAPAWRDRTGRPPVRCCDWRKLRRFGWPRSRRASKGRFRRSAVMRAL